MSRIPSNSSSASNGPGRLKISAPQPYQPPAKAYLPTTASLNGPNGQAADGSRRPSGGSESGRAGPMRPARSIRRAPQPPTTASPLTAMSYTETPARMYPDEGSGPVNRLAPRPQRQASRDDDYAPLTPVEAPGGSGSAGSSAWEFERSQRTQMLDQQRQQSDHENKLRNVVGAFASSNKGKEVQRGANGAGDGRKKQTREGREQELFMGSGREEFSDIDSVLRKIQREWPFVLDQDFAPSSLALSLLSSSSQQRSHPGLSSFLALHASLAGALQQAVQRHYQTYASSLPAHAALLSSLGRAQGMVRDAKKQLKESRELLTGGAGKSGPDAPPGGKRAEMGLLWAKERMLRDMLKTLDAIENLKQVADKLETMIGDKRFLQASIVLMRSLKVVDKEEMREIGALAELRTYLKGQQQTLADILVEELHSHLYLKSMYCDGRWKAYQQGQTEIHPAKQGATRTTATPRVSYIRDTDSKANGPSRLSTYLEQLSLQVSRNPLLDVADDDLTSTTAMPIATHRRGMSATAPSASVGSMSGITGAAPPGSQGPNLEADSFAFMEMVLESLACLGKLSWAVEVIGQRVTAEIRGLVEGVVHEVEERNELRQLEKQTMQRPGSIVAIPGRPIVDTEVPRSTRPRRGTLSAGAMSASLAAGESPQLSGLEKAGGPAERETLLDFFWTLYSKLYAVVEGHRVVYEVVTRLAVRPDYNSGSRGKGAQPYALPIGEVWKPIRAEVRSLLTAYLTDRGRGAASIRAPIASVNEILRDGRTLRAPQRIVFKFSDTDKKAVVKDISSYEDELNRSLTMSVPGLVLNSAGDAASGNLAIALNGEDAAQNRQQRLLVAPNPFNVSVIYRPYIAFVSAVRDVIPAGFEDDMEPFGEFLNDFVVKVYLPQLEDKVTSLLQSAISGADAFQLDAGQKHVSGLPVVKSASRVMALVNSLCSMLATTPFNKEDYSRLIVGVIVRYYQRCSSYYRDLVVTFNAKAENPISLSSVWAQKEEMVACLEDLQKADDVEAWRRQEMCSHETRLEIGLLDGNNVSMIDLVTSTAQLAGLGHLAHSMRWFRDALQALTAVSDDMLSPSLERHKRESMYGLDDLTEPGVPRLTLSTAMAQRLDAILSTYSQLADMIEFTMRLELRTRAMAFISASFAKGNYRIEAEAAEPDPYILDWTADLSECHAAVAASLPDDHKQFLFLGIGELVDQLLITCARAARYVTPEGVLKIRRNMLAVQQALCIVVDDPSRAELPRARAYWALYEKGPKAMLEDLQIGKPLFTFDDYNHMLNLQCKVDPRASARLSGQGQANGRGGASSIASDRAAPDAERDAYNSYLIELHSLAMSMDDF